jgi:hypothetical protein
VGGRQGRVHRKAAVHHQRPHDEVAEQRNEDKVGQEQLSVQLAHEGGRWILVLGPVASSGGGGIESTTTVTCLDGIDDSKQMDGG